MPISSILIVSDLSERSDRALRRGLSLAAALGAEAAVVSVVDEALPREIADDLAAKYRNHLDAAIADAGAEVDCAVSVEIGDPAERLVQIANQPKYDLVVAGRHRARGIADDFRKTTVERLVANTLKPVLLAVSPGRGAYKSALALTAFSPACRRAVETARELAPGAALRIAHVWAAPFEGLTGGDAGFARAVERETRKRADAWGAELAGGPATIELVHGAVGSTLHDEVRRTSPELLAIGAHTRSLSLTGLGSMAAELLRDPPTDLLIATGAA